MREKGWDSIINCYYSRNIPPVLILNEIYLVPYLCSIATWGQRSSGSTRNIYLGMGPPTHCRLNTILPELTKNLCHVSFFSFTWVRILCWQWSESHSETSLLPVVAHTCKWYIQQRKSILCLISVYTIFPWLRFPHLMKPFGARTYRIELVDYLRKKTMGLTPNTRKCTPKSD